MIIDIKIPSPGESITEVVLAQWLVEDGVYVIKDQELGEIESDKATLPLLAEKAGKLKILIPAGTTTAVGAIACSIDTEAKAPATNTVPVDREKQSKSVEKSDRNETVTAKEPVSETYPNAKITPLAKKMMEEENLSIEELINGLKKITTSEVKKVKGLASSKIPAIEINAELPERKETRESMTPLRKKLSERLVAVRNQTAMLTTFNEVDMRAVMEMRSTYQKAFSEKYGIKLGFMSFFTKAVSIALHNFPKINSRIEGDEIISPNFTDIAIAVQTDKGLMVPVIRNTSSLNLAEIELQIAELAKRARNYRLTPEEMSGGTFTITNGGVFGSMLSTPIINPPQSAILGMHNIVDRPVALNGQVVIRPIMYVALSYDHRIVDGRDSVSFLVKVKELIENPHKLLFTDINPDKLLLGL